MKSRKLLHRAIKKSLENIDESVYLGFPGSFAIVKRGVFIEFKLNVFMNKNSPIGKENTIRAEVEIKRYLRLINLWYKRYPSIISRKIGTMKNEVLYAYNDRENKIKEGIRKPGFSKASTKV